jgi:uncharacterized protein (DUF58 family)
VSLESPLAPDVVEGAAQPLGRLAVALRPRSLALLLFGLAWLVPAFTDRHFAWAMVAWDGVVLALCGLDALQLPASGLLIVRRAWPELPALSVRSAVQLVVTNRSTTPLVAFVLDTVPSPLREAPPRLRVALPADGDATTGYDIQPIRRGDVTIGNVYVRYHGRLGLAERWAVAKVEQTVVVYPNLSDAKRHSVHLVRSRQIELEKRSTRSRGQGRAFESLREYLPGDEVRDICWTASARRGKPVTRLYEMERSQTIWIVIDAGRLMRARVDGLSKLDHAVNAALALCHVGLSSGDRVGVLAYGRRILQRVPDDTGSAHLRRVIDRLARVDEDEWEADHLLAASRLMTDQKRRCLIVWMTDLAESAMTPEVVRATARLMTRHLVLFVVIGEPDLQRTAARTPRRVSEMYETAAAQEVVHRRELTLARLRERGALAVETDAAGLSLAVVNRYLDVKQRNRL